MQLYAHFTSQSVDLLVKKKKKKKNATLIVSYFLMFQIKVRVGSVISLFSNAHFESGKRSL